MKNFIKVFALVALVAAIGVSCSSAPPFTTLQEPIKPDSKSAVVIFLQSSSTEAQVWDGEKPVGTFNGLKASSRYCMFWKTTPGAHTFVARSSNFVNTRMNLQAGRTYYIRVHKIPSPPYTTLIAMEEYSKQDYDDFMSKSKFLKTTDIEFDNEWRKEFLAENNGKNLNELKEYLKTAK